MKATEFCYWLQGYFELMRTGNAAPATLTPEQVRCIQNHLNLVFKHDIDPSYGGNQQELQDIHDGVQTNAPGIAHPHGEWVPRC